MSTFKTYDQAVTGEVLISNIPTHSSSPNNGFSVSSISVTNSDTTLDSCYVKVFLEDTSTPAVITPVMDVNVPRQSTVVYDVPFSFMKSGSLKITTDNNSEITVIIN